MKEQTALSEEGFAPPSVHVSTKISFAPEAHPFPLVIVDVTHRCNMACSNCYIPNRDIPDMDVDWLRGILARFPRRARVRLVGAEPTMRRDLPDIIRMIRKVGHIPILLSNGLRLGNLRYVRELKAAGLRTVYLSLNGGLLDEYYEAVDGMRCAARKLKSLATVLKENLHVTAGMIVVPGVNEHHVGDFFRYLSAGRVQGLHLRSVGAIGRHMPHATLSLAQLISIAVREIGVSEEQIHSSPEESVSSREFMHEGMLVQLTEWPDLGSSTRGRLTPEGRVEPFFEHIILNAGRGGY